VWQRRFGGPATDAADRARQMRFLAGRGFDTEVIRRVVKATDND
jgi:regulatory protein